MAKARVKQNTEIEAVHDVNSMNKKRKKTISESNGTTIKKKKHHNTNNTEDYMIDMKDDILAIVKESKELAKKEIESHERLIKTLQKDLQTLTSQRQKEEQKYQKKIETMESEYQSKVETLQREKEKAQELNEKLQQKLNNLDSSDGKRRKSSKYHRSSIILQENEENQQMTQMRKLLALYRVVTGTEIQLIESMDDDEDSTLEECTDITCTIVDSSTKKRFQFDLAIPDNSQHDIEYLPLEDQRDFDPTLTIPTYLQSELSFKREEMSKFMRTILDVVIRKPSMNK